MRYNKMRMLIIKEVTSAIQEAEYEPSVTDYKSIMEQQEEMKSMYKSIKIPDEKSSRAQTFHIKDNV